MNPWLIFLLVVLAGHLLLEWLVGYLNLRALSSTLPAEYQGVYSDTDYARSQEYTRATTKLSLLSASVSTGLTLLFIVGGGFNWVDLQARSFGLGEIWTGLVFCGILILLSFLLNLPFSLYSTFIIEEKFGFNRTTLATFCLDTLKAALLLVVIGGPLLALIQWFFIATGAYAWLYCWLGVVLFSLLIHFLAPIIILPLFNTFTPLAPGSLRDAIQGYAVAQQYKIAGIFTMDGSKRSTKLNAFFTGFGKFKKIVFFDTLVEKLSEDEIVAVLAHEMGHLKHRHILKMLFFSIIQTGLMFALLSLMLNNQMLFSAFAMENLSVYGSLVFFSLLYSPVSTLASLLANYYSRKHEFEADTYAAHSTSSPEALITALKVLSKENLSNLTPHPAQVFFHYSHPPVLARINALRRETNLAGEGI
jgi:STE24 endopeptidase